MRVKIRAPAEAKSMTTLMNAVAVYESDMIDFLKAGGTEPSDSGQRGQLVKILPKLSMETLDVAHNIKAGPELIVWMRAKGKFYKECGGGEAHLHFPDDHSQRLERMVPPSSSGLEPN